MVTCAVLVETTIIPLKLPLKSHSKTTKTPFLSFGEHVGGSALPEMVTAQSTYMLGGM